MEASTSNLFPSKTWPNLTPQDSDSSMAQAIYSLHSSRPEWLAGSAVVQ